MQNDVSKNILRTSPKIIMNGFSSFMNHMGEISAHNYWEAFYAELKSLQGEVKLALEWKYKFSWMIWDSLLNQYTFDAFFPLYICIMLWDDVYICSMIWKYWFQVFLNCLLLDFPCSYFLVHFLFIQICSREIRFAGKRIESSSI